MASRSPGAEERRITCLDVLEQGVAAFCTAHDVQLVTLRETRLDLDALTDAQSALPYLVAACQEAARQMGLTHWTQGLSLVRDSNADFGLRLEIDPQPPSEEALTLTLYLLNMVVHDTLAADPERVLRLERLTETVSSHAERALKTRSPVLAPAAHPAL